MEEGWGWEQPGEGPLSAAAVASLAAEAAWVQPSPGMRRGPWGGCTAKASSDSALLPQSVGDKHRMSFPETVDEILDVSEDEGEAPELGHTIPELPAGPERQAAAPGVGTGTPAGRVGGSVAPQWSCREVEGSPPDSWGGTSWLGCFPALCRRDIPEPLHGPVPQGQCAESPRARRASHLALPHGVVPAPSPAAAGLLLLVPAKTSPLPLLTLQALLMSQ